MNRKGIMEADNYSFRVKYLYTMFPKVIMHLISIDVGGR